MFITKNGEGDLVVMSMAAYEQREATLDLLSELRARAVTVLVSTHDLDLAARRFDQVVLLNGRLISAGLPSEVFTPEHLHEAFGGQMVVVDGMSIVVDQCCGGGDRFAHALPEEDAPGDVAHSSERAEHEESC